MPKPLQKICNGNKFLFSFIKGCKLELNCTTNDCKKKMIYKFKNFLEVVRKRILFKKKFTNQMGTPQTSIIPPQPRDQFPIVTFTKEVRFKRKHSATHAYKMTMLAFSSNCRFGYQTKTHEYFFNMWISFVNYHLMFNFKFTKINKYKNKKNCIATNLRKIKKFLGLHLCYNCFYK